MCSENPGTESIRLTRGEGGILHWGHTGKQVELCVTMGGEVGWGTIGIVDGRWGVEGKSGGRKVVGKKGKGGHEKPSRNSLSMVGRGRVGKVMGKGGASPLCVLSGGLGGC